MLKRSLAFCTILAAVLSLCSPLSAAAQQPTAEVQVDASLQTNRAYLGDTVRMQVTVQGADNASAAAPSSGDGFTSVFKGGQDVTSTWQMNINGRVTQGRREAYLLHYDITPQRTGWITIEPFTVTVYGREHRTPELRLFVIEPETSEHFALELQVEKERAYVGEPVRATLVWTVGANVRSWSFAGLGESSGYDIVPAPGAPDRGVEVEFAGSTLTGEVGRAQVGDRIVQQVRFELLIVPRQPGTLSLGPVRAVFDEVVGERPRQLMDSIFTDRTVVERVSATAEAATLEVLPLPESGRPQGFTGLIGSFKVAANADASEVNVGDPVSLRVTVTGTEPLERVPPIDFTRQPGFDAFKTPSELVVPQIRDGRAVYEAMIRPRDDSVDAIPPVRLPYFDVDAGEYRVAESAPIPLTVRPTSVVSLGASGEVGDRDSAPVEHRPAGLSPIARELGRPVLGSGDLHALVTSPAVLALVGAPAGAWLMALGVVAVRRRGAGSERAVRRRRALRRAQRRLRASRSVEGDAALREIAGAIVGAVADATGRPEESMTHAECLALVRGADADVAERLRPLLVACNAGRFGGFGLSAEQLRTEAERLLPDVVNAVREARA